MIEIDPRLLIAKLTFGPSARDLEESARIGTDRWVEEQLHPTADDGCNDRIAAARWRLKYRVPNPAFDASVPNKAPQFIEADEDRAVAVINRPIEEHWQVIEKNLPGPERTFFRLAVSVATIVRAVHSRWQLRELLVDFWHNHFNVNAAGEALVAVSLPSYDRDVIRAHALGNFRTLLEAVGCSAAMQVYLNNRSSRGGAANENYAREMFELHTLGRPAYLNALYSRWRDVPGAAQGKPQGYIDQDVYEAARAFTGWTIEDGTGLGAGRKLPVTGKPTYVEIWHDNYQKRILATEFDPYQPAMSDGRKVLDLVAEHPATARYVCGKLCKRLVSDNPSAALIEATAKIWTEHQRAPDQIARVVVGIVRSEEFRRSAGAKVKRPLELVASFARATGIPLSVTPGLLNELDASGQRLFGWGPPTGHPDDTAYWLSSNALRHRWSLLIGLADNAWATGQPRVAESVAAEPTVGRALITAHQALFGTAPVERTASAILEGMNLHPHDAFSNRKDAPALSRRLLAYCGMLPPFQIR
jgi:uncharacterized protein (DUF1800 family)